MAKRKLVFKGKLISVYTAKLRLPNKCVTNLEIIKHPGAALIIPFLNRDSIIMLKQFRPVINAYIYELPAGTLEPKEKPYLCARREIVEEVGYRAKIFKRLGKIYPVPGYSTEQITIYKAQDLQRKIGLSDADEIIKTVVVDKTKVRKLFNNGKIVDAKTICALTMCGWL
jgi:ADP-ribose pyrophosphatase